METQEEKLIFENKKEERKKKKERGVTLERTCRMMITIDIIYQ